MSKSKERGDGEEVVTKEGVCHLESVGMCLWIERCILKKKKKERCILSGSNIGEEWRGLPKYVFLSLGLTGAAEPEKMRYMGMLI